MFYSIWLLAAALAGWVSGKIAQDDGFGTLADILLGITGAFVVRWSLENIGHFPERCVPASVLDLGCSRIASCCETWDQTPQSVKSAIPTPKLISPGC